jgi:H+/Cl- antiporter ClcA
MAAGVGVGSSLLATGFVVVQHDSQAWLWERAPDALGWAQPPWWWVMALLGTGALLTSLALRLPGGGGHSPLDGFAFDVGPRVAVSAVAAAFASLTFGAVLGPEAPALALGTAFGAAVARVRVPSNPVAAQEQRTLLMLAGGMAAFGAVLGNPLALAVFMLEAALVARRRGSPDMMLAPVAVALAFGYVVQVGVGGWVGLGEVVLAVPGLGSYPQVRVVDLALAVPVAALVAATVLGALRGATAYAAWAAGRPALVPMLVAALGTAVLAISARALVDAPVELVLFSGQSAMPDLLASTSIAVVVVVLAAKAVAYALCLGSGFRGGLIFPAVYLGVGIATATALAVGTDAASGLVAAGIAAAAAAAIRLPFSAALLATLLTASAGLAVTTPALVGAVVGLLTALAVDRRAGPRVVAAEAQS